MKFHIIKTLFIIIIFGYLSYSQDIGNYGIKSWSDHYEIQNHFGVAYIFQLISNFYS